MFFKQTLTHTPDGFASQTLSKLWQLPGRCLVDVHTHTPNVCMTATVAVWLTGQAVSLLALSEGLLAFSLFDVCLFYSPQ